ncbi:hypothetical protein E2562_015117 [Oryza meyeriana var. granulata]|uniref:Uncharacterized protein n=1 Tax=Oryza meyeriana var. granulata TaxID=110450 RepID=A0A6G1DXW5_9ORYZ|nr:hypothetical protein E2562_015117 [Oryza meyeriana var. granulata]
MAVTGADAASESVSCTADPWVRECVRIRYLETGDAPHRDALEVGLGFPKRCENSSRTAKAAALPVGEVMTATSSAPAAP